MIELTENLECLSPCFDPNLPNHPMLFGILAGRNPGRVVVDQSATPHQCAVLTSDRLLFVGRATDQAFLDEALHYFRPSGHVGLIASTYASPSQLALPQAAKILNRREFTARAHHPAAWMELKRRLPENGEVRLADHPLLERCEWRSSLEAASGSLERYLSSGLSYCLLQNQDLVAEAHAPFRGEGVVEIGVTTHPAHQGRGYATAVCAYLIEACEQHGLQTYWSCDADNLPSLAVARKLGFGGERDYQILFYRAIR